LPDGSDERAAKVTSNVLPLSLTLLAVATHNTNHSRPQSSRF
jgi:hypothetical protein